MGGSVRLVTSQIVSFEQLVRVERGLRSLPSVRRLDLEDFRQGVATHRATLRAPMTPEELAPSLGELRAPPLALEGVTAEGLELRVEREVRPDLIDLLPRSTHPWSGRRAS